MEQGPGGAERRWNGQIEDLRMYSSYQDAVGIHGEAIELEWKILQGFSTLSILQEIQKDLQEKNIQLENFEASSCQCSMAFCGKQMMRIASRTQKKSRITQRNSYQDIGLFRVQGRQRDGMANLTINRDSGIAQPTKWYSNSKKLAIPSSQGTTALSRGILKQRRGRSTIHFNGDTVNTELRFKQFIP